MVFDGYGGSGTTLIASYVEGRSCITSEKKEEYYNLITKRFKEQTTQLKLL
jgi:DNA modification methylase